MKRALITPILTSLLILLNSGCEKKEDTKSDGTTEATKHVEASAPKSANLVKTAKEWIPAHDEFGSSYDTAKAILSDSLKKVSYTLTKKNTEDKWPYIELISIVGGNLQGKKELKLKYSCSTPLIIKLSQSDFNDKGNKTYSHYQYTVPASDTLLYISTKISEYAQPDWAPEESKNIPLKLENVDAVYFTPNIDAEVGGKADLSIKEFYLD